MEKLLLSELGVLPDILDPIDYPRKVYIAKEVDEVDLAPALNKLGWVKVEDLTTLLTGSIKDVKKFASIAKKIKIVPKTIKL